MIALWMTYATVVALLACIAASTAERALRLAKRPARVVWIGAMTFVCLIPLATTRRAPAATELVTATTTSVIRASTDTELGDVAARQPGPSRAPVTAGSALARLDRPLIVAWIAGSLLWSLMLALSAMTIIRRRRSWTAATMDGVTVLISRDVGPAVVGLVRTEIVVPTWVTTLAPEQRALVLAHEREHARARDPLLLAAGALTLLAMPWNAALWYALSRLRLAVEVDCDGRVLRAHPNVRAYSSLLVDVTERNMRSAMHLAALGDSPSQLARRLTLLTARVPRHLAARVGGAAMLTVGSIIVACATPKPAPIPRPTDTSATVRAASPALPDSQLAKAPDSTASRSAGTPARQSPEQLSRGTGKRSSTPFVVDTLVPVSRTDIEEALLILDARPDSMLTPRDIRTLASLVRARRDSARLANTPRQEPPPVPKEVIRRAVETYYPTALTGGLGSGAHYLWFTGDRTNRVLGHASGRGGLQSLWVQEGEQAPHRQITSIDWEGVVKMVPGTPASMQRRGDLLQVVSFPIGADTVVAVWARLWGASNER